MADFSTATGKVMLAQLSLPRAAGRVGFRRINVRDADIFAVIPKGVAIHDAVGAAQVQTVGHAPGEPREVALADGTHIRLNAASKITVSLERHARRVQMADVAGRQIEAQLLREVAFDDLAVVQVHLDLEVPRADLGDRRMRVVLAIEEEARHVARVDRLDHNVNHCPTICPFRVACKAVTGRQ